MRLYAKIFLCGTAIFSAAFLFAGYLLLTDTYQNELNREKEIALKQYQYDKFTVQSEILSEWKGVVYGFPEETDLFERLVAKLGDGTAFYLEKTRPLISTLPEGIDDSIVKDLRENAISYRFLRAGERHYLLTGGKISQNGTTIYMLRATEITAVTERRREMEQKFQEMYLTVFAASMAVMLLLSAFITRPLKKMTVAAERIAQGDYKERLVPRGSDEIAELTRSFNTMTDSVEEKVEELSEALRQREEFNASFAHELKTPLTSVIGYADMLYQRELSRQEIKDAAWYIMNEGMRVEALAQKLMDLFVLGRNEFLLVEMPAEEVLENVLLGIEPILRERKAELSVEAEPAYIRVEIDLFKTLLWNLIDNATKAGSSRIEVEGRQNGDSYLVLVRDNGCGIPKEEIGKITEAFYMVDKSRSRKQHGAGLGLALCKQIARIHGSDLVIESREGEETVVSLELLCEKEVEDV